MEWLQELMRQEGLVPSDSPNASMRSKLISKADQMLRELDTYKTEAELDGKSVKYWWSPQSVNGQRRVMMRLNGKAVEGSSVYANNTLPDVRKAVEALKRAVERGSEEQWAAVETQRRKK